MSKLSSVYRALIMCLLFISTSVFCLHAPVKNLLLDTLSVNDGLSQGTAKVIFQDDTGLVWIGTENGVNIYDGYSVRQLPGPNNRFSDFSVYGIKQDKQGLMWLNIDGKGLYTFDAKTNKYQLILANDPDNVDYYITDYVEDEDGNFWISTTKTLGVYDKNTGKFQQIADLSDEIDNKNPINHILISQNIIYIGTRSGAFVFHTKTAHFRKLPPISSQTLSTAVKDQIEANKVYTLYLYNQKDLYLGTNDGVYRLDISTIDRFIKHLTNLPQYELAYSKISPWQFIVEGKQLYIGSDIGLTTIDMATKETRRLFGFSDAFDHVSDDNIISLMRDKDGLFWLGSNSFGAYIWNPKREVISNFGYKRQNKASLSHNEVWDIKRHHSNDDMIWVGTSNGLNLVDTKNETVQQFLVNPDSKSLYTSSRIYQSHQYSEQQVFLATPEGIKLFDIQSNSFIPLPYQSDIKDLLKAEQYSTFFDQDKSLWLINEFGVFHIFLSTGEIDPLPELTSALPFESIFAILGYLPNSNTLLLSTNNALWGYDVVKRQVKKLYQHPGISPADWSSIDNWTIDGQNILWLSFTSKGLIGLSLPNFDAKYFYHKGNSILNNNIYGALTDPDGDVWVSTHSGIFMLDSETQHIRRFDMNDGFSAIEFNSLAYLKRSDNSFVYGSMEGISIFDPIQLKHNASESDFIVNITHVDVMSRDISVPMTLTDNAVVNLAYNDVGIRVDFSTLSFANNYNIRFEYSLQGNNDVEYPSTTENHIIFPSLPSGEHTLTIRAKSPITGKYSKPTLLRFNVSYAPWSSPYAYAVYIIVCAILILFWLKKRFDQRKKLLDAHEQVKYRENRLQLALTGSNSEVWDWQADQNLIFAKRIIDELGFSEYDSSYKFDDHIDLIHPEDRDNYLKSWQLFLSNADIDSSFICTYRMKNIEDQWLWYKDLGKIVAVDHRGKPSRVTGSYTNITQSRADEERAQYYGEAFKQTKDWVLIISDNFKRVTANNSFCEVFGISENEFKFSMRYLGLQHQRKQHYIGIFKSLKEGEHWRGEELISTPKGEEYHVTVNINVCKTETLNCLSYICVFSDITAQKNAEQELRYLANYDHLTNLPNRSLLLERVKHAMALSQRKHHSIALFFIDLDRFKQINDSLGHDYGDMLLREITSRLTQVLRIDDTVARIGGDEFVVLLESYRNNSQLSQIAQKIISTVEQPVHLNEHVVSVGASIGIALYPEDATDSDVLLKNADVAMYHAKQLGRNTFQFFTQRMNFEASERLDVESKIKQAHLNDEFINHYQPIVDASTGKAIGAELLMRWQSEDKLIPPNEFIPFAEEIGLIVEMTENAMHRGLVDLSSWLKIRPEMYLSVNISAKHFVKEGLVKFVMDILTEYNIPQRCLKLEITESTLISEPEKVISTMRELANHGIKLSLDDFGTGYSSLSYLKKLPLDIIKIDRSFVTGIGLDKADEAIVEATLVLAKRLDMNCIAEGVETKAQLNYLAQRECTFIQGYLYSKPVENAMIVDYLNKNTVELIATKANISSF